jgi:hypothetical protein
MGLMGMNVIGIFCVLRNRGKTSSSPHHLIKIDFLFSRDFPPAKASKFFSLKTFLRSISAVRFLSYHVSLS